MTVFTGSLLLVLALFVARTWVFNPTSDANVDLSTETETEKGKTALENPSVKIILCDEALEGAEGELTKFLESGELSMKFQFDVIEDIQNGGLRGIRVKVACLEPLIETRSSTAHAEWRVTLTKGELTWTVIKMTRLES